MADIKLFSITSGKAQNKVPVDLKLEKEIQTLCENNLEVFFGIQFLASEYSTGKNHKCRIDSLGIDENNCTIIIEYKRDSKENVINHGLFYLDWLMDHKGDFELLCMKKFGEAVEVDWSSPRLLCIAKDFTRYDDYAIAHINRNIELIRYRYFEGDHIIFELASSVQGQKVISNVEIKNSSTNSTYKQKTIEEVLKEATLEMEMLYQQVEQTIWGMGDDVLKEELKYYHAFARIKNFACVEVRPQKKEVLIYLKVDFSSIENPTKNIRDVSKIGHFGTGDNEVIIKSTQDIEAVKYLIEESYNRS